jgi:hypothetical protein
LRINCVPEGVNKAGLIQGDKDPASVNILSPFSPIGCHMKHFLLTIELKNLDAKNFDRYVTFRARYVSVEINKHVQG